MRCASGSDAPVSSSLISFEAALTLVAMLLRPFLRVRPSYSSRSSPAVTTTLVGRLGRRRRRRRRPRRSALGSSTISTETSPSTPCSADGAERLDATCRRRPAARPAPARRRVVAGSDADDPAEAAAVLEEAVDGVGEVRALHERAVVRVRRVAVDAGELRPVRDPHRRVDRPARGEADEGGDRGPDALDRLRLRRDLLDVDPGRQVRSACQLPPRGPVVRCSSSVSERLGMPARTRRGDGAARVVDEHLATRRGPRGSASRRARRARASASSRRRCPRRRQHDRGRCEGRRGRPAPSSRADISVAPRPRGPASIRAMPRRTIGARCPRRTRGGTDRGRTHGRSAGPMRRGRDAADRGAANAGNGWLPVALTRARERLRGASSTTRSASPGTGSSHLRLALPPVRRPRAEAVDAGHGSDHEPAVLVARGHPQPARRPARPTPPGPARPPRRAPCR